MYQLLVAAEYKDAKSRARFLSNLLKPFAPACSLADAEAAAREDCHKLAFLVNVAAALPFRRADEPLLLIHAVNGHVSRQAQEVLDCLRRQLSARGLRAKMGLEDDADDDADAATAAAGGDAQAVAAAGDEQAAVAAAQKQQRRLQPPFPVELLAPLKASLCLSMLLVLKQYLMAAYSLSDERVAGFELKGAKYQGEAKALASRDKRLPEFSLGVVNLRALGDATGELLVEAFKTFRGLLDNDAANYRWGVQKQQVASKVCCLFLRGKGSVCASYGRMCALKARWSVVVCLRQLLLPPSTVIRCVLQQFKLMK